MSLADELLADLEDAGEEVEQPDQEAPEEVPEVAEVPMAVENLQQSVRNIAKLRDSIELKEILAQIDYYIKSGGRKMTGPVEADPEYQLIVEANNITVEIDNEINVIHKFVRDLYYKRFPELESLVQTSLEYVKTVKELGNSIEKSKQSEVLQAILTPATIMVVSVTASTTQGSELSQQELDTLLEACDMAIELTAYKKTIFDYVESRMGFIAPNLSIIVGASTAAKIMGQAGGLTNLSKMPACNVLVLGAQKKTLSGFSNIIRQAGGLTNLSKMPACNVLVLGAQKKTLSGFSNTNIMPHTGYVYYSDIVQKTPPDLRKKAARLVSAKCALASRVDSFHESQDATTGTSLKADIEAKLEKLQEPPPVKTIKPLPAPIEPSRKKRGGRRYRKMKERLGMTDMRKMANRMNFAEIEDDAYQEDLGFSLGTLGKKSSGRIRGPPVDSKTKAKVSKSLQQKLAKQNQTWGGSTTVKKQISGTASSVAFTPLQGLEIVNPQAAETRVREANQKYFSSTGGFFKVKKN